MRAGGKYLRLHIPGYDREAISHTRVSVAQLAFRKVARKSFKGLSQGC